MNNQIIFISIGLIIALLAGIAINISAVQSDVAGIGKYAKCQAEMIKAISDPNDTEGRAKFLKDNC